MEESSRTVSESRKFFGDIIWVAMSQVFTSLLGIVTLPALTRTYTTADFGIWAQVSATVSLAVPLLTLQFGATISRFLAGEDDKAKRRRSLGSMLTAILIFAGTILVITNFLTQPLSSFLFGNPNYVSFVHLTFFWTFTNSLFTFFIAYQRALRRMKRLSIIQASFAASNMGGIVLLAALGVALQWVIGCLISVELAFTFFVLYLIIREDGFPTLNFTGTMGFLIFSVPQIPAGVLMWIISSSDRYFITHFVDLSQTGIYSSSNTIGGIIALFYAPISFVLLPAVSKAWEQERMADVKNYFQYSIRLFLTLAIPGAAGLAILSQPLLKTLATSAYMAGWQLVLMISVGTIFLGIYQINVYVIYLVKKTKWLPLMIAVASAASAGTNLVLIPRIGIIGAAVSNMISYLVLAAIVTIWARKAIRYSFDFAYAGKVIVSSFAILVCLYFLRPNDARGIILGVIIGAVVFVLTMLLLRGFSTEERLFIKRAIGGKSSRRAKGATAMKGDRGTVLSYAGYATNHLGILKLYGGIRSLAQPRVPILLYHRVGDSKYPWSLAETSVSEFEAEMAYLSHNYEVVDLQTIVRCLQEMRPLPRKAAAITIDDGYRDNYVNAFPILRKLHMPATIFLATGYLDSGELFWWDKLRYVVWHVPMAEIELDGFGRFDLSSETARREAAVRIEARLKQIPEAKKCQVVQKLSSLGGVETPLDLARELVLSWNDVREMKSNGVSFGAHTVTHPILTRVSARRAQWEVVESRKRIEAEIGGSVTFFAYPNGHPGDYNDRVKEQLHDAGFTCALTASPPKLTIAQDDPLQLGRISAGSNLDFFKFSLELLPDAWSFYRGKMSSRLKPEWGGDISGG